MAGDNKSAAKEDLDKISAESKRWQETTLAKVSERSPLRKREFTTVSGKPV